MIVGQLLQIPAAEQVGTAVANVGDAELGIVHPNNREGGAHTALFGVFLGRLINFHVGEMHGAFQTLGFQREIVAGLAVEGLAGVLLGFRQVFGDGFHSHGTGDFAVSFAAHSVGKDKEGEGFYDAEGILIVGAHTTNVRQATAGDLHELSFHTTREHGGHPLRREIPRYSVLSTLAEPPLPGKALRPSDYSPISHTERSENGCSEDQWARREGYPK